MIITIIAVTCLISIMAFSNPELFFSVY